MSHIAAWLGLVFLCGVIGWHACGFWHSGKRVHSVLLLLSLIPVGHGHSLLLERLETEAAKTLIEEAIDG